MGFTDDIEVIAPKIHGIRLPKFRLSEKDLEKYNLDKNVSSREAFNVLVDYGFQERLKNDLDLSLVDEYKKRLEYEKSVIGPTDFTDYLMMVWDVVNIAKQHGIAVGPGRGCLSADSLIVTNKGLKQLKDIKIGDFVINRYGQLDRVTNTMEYDCLEPLIKFTSQGSCNKLQPFMTKDHKVLVLKNPFKNLKKNGWIKNFRKLDLNKYFYSKNLRWIESNNIEIGDYFTRYIGRTSPIKDIEVIDLAEFCEKFDNEFIYEYHDLNTSHPLCLNAIHRETGISESCIKNFKLGKGFKIKGYKEKLLSYLSERSFSVEDLVNFKSRTEIKIPRFLSVDYNFCYVLGFFIGDGWYNSSRIGFGLHSEDNIEEEAKITNYFKQFNLHINSQKHPKKKLNQLYINSSVFSKLFYKYVKNGCNFKCIPEGFLDLPDTKIKGLLDGLIESDGSNKENRISFDSTSFKLAHQVRWLLEYFGNTCSITVRDQIGYSRSYKVRGKNGNYNSSSFNDGKFIFSKITNKELVENKDKKVYDISVKENPSYHTLDFIVHNSSASSFVNYCLGITNIDPVKYNLYFERFLSEARVTANIVDGVKYYSDAADIDLDIEDSRREELVELLKVKYKGHFCKISNAGTLKSKICIKDVCKVVLGYSESQSQEISSLVPSLFGKNFSLEKTVEEVPAFAAFVEKHPKVYKIARKLSDLIYSRGSHASAYIISYEPLLDTIPCCMGESEMVTSYDMEYAQINNIKLDLLGLKAIGIINEVCKNLNLNPNKFDLNYDTVFKYLQDVQNPYGLFQVSGDCNLRVVNKVKPKDLDQLAAVTALARPGALQFVDRYASFTNEGKNESVHPFFDELLSNTAGLALYQESTMKMCEKIGLTKAEGEIIRKVIGKKQVEKVKQWESKIFDTVKANGLDEEIAKVLWRILEDSANYSFNKCLGRSTIIETENGYKMLFEVTKGEKVKAFNVLSGKDHFVEVLKIHENKVELFEVEMEDGRKIEASLDHKFLCEKVGMKTLREIVENNFLILTD